VAGVDALDALTDRVGGVESGVQTILELLREGR
jgi:hypothetical protein